MYLLGKTWGWYGQFRLWYMIQNEIVDVFNVERDHLLRMSELMKKYRDVPMDFADASLVAAAEALGTNKIFTLDSDFNIYRMNGRKHFEIIP